MVNRKQIYESPDITETRVELESSICSGSVDIQNPEDKGDRNSAISEQTINQDFSGSSFNTGGWTETSTQN